MVTIQWLVYMVVVCCACLGVLFLLFSFMAKQVAKQTAKHKEKITFIRYFISVCCPHRHTKQGRVRWVAPSCLAEIIRSNMKGFTMPQFIKALCLAAFLAFSVGTLNTAHASTTLLDITIAGTNWKVKLTGTTLKLRKNSNQTVCKESAAFAVQFLECVKLQGGIALFNAVKNVI
jgi:hypothetical protein